MLVLSRREGEAIYIGDSIKVVLLSVNGNKTRIGIEAPGSITVHREEVYGRIQLKKTNCIADTNKEK